MAGMGNPRPAEAAGTDIFDSALHLEEQHIHEGYQDGLQAGRRSGRAEGKALGLQKGFEVGHEVGYYSGCCQLWRQLQTQDPQLWSQRVDKGIAALEEMVADFPLGNPRDERLQELMDGMRGKFKALLAMMGLQHAYRPPAQQQQQQSEGGAAGRGDPASFDF
ncbi:hypothetical protein D9Q98_002732 [Chlorella vulgaris]|uniref:Essential protein Yae1 N-terminal domain-containing protein n=1 Tax=Chlorella vulgaris TaxID=3077 RepID=A0A9D4TUG0_CHLVU|nr:hypothetical protein D9Q98_002732 [Chlorella vulgaris]